MMDVIIRPFQFEDTEELWQLHAVTVLASGFNREVVEWDTDLHSISESYTAKGGYFIVAEAVDKKLIGMGGYIPTTTTSIELKRMRVHPDFQHAGIGKKILKSLEHEALKSGFTYVQLDTANAKVQPFYQRNGYRFVKSEIDGEFMFYFFEKDLQSTKQSP
jgi:GNAT superfamily N-acetyltransferase